MATRVFISYASADLGLARQVCGWLEADRHEVFLAQDLREGIAAGERWRSRLHERLRWADAVVCVVTSAAVASPWCSYEVSTALSRGSRLIPILAEVGVTHPLLGDLQHLDLTRDPATVPVALAEALRRLDAAGGLGWEDDRSPFPGLRPLDVDEHRVFFARRSEVGRLAALVRSPAERAEGAVLLVVGPSGCGKSSLVRAGLVHVMAEEPGWWTLAPILPGADPVAALARELAAAARQLGLDWTVEGVGRRLEDTGLTGLADELLVTARARRLLVVVDQFEELLTQTPPEHRAHFAQLLRPALSGPVQVVATLRPEFLDQLLLDTDLAVLPTHPYTLRPLHREALRTVIEGPAQLAGIGVEDDLVARLVSDTDTGEALPLLAFTLAQLAEGVTRGGQLSIVRYEQLGGVQGAMSRQADAALAQASAASGRGRAEVIAGLLRLVTVDEQGRPTRWRVPRDGLPELVTRELDVFVTRRLLTTDTENDRVVVGVAHEAFLSAWAPLAQAIEENASALRARRALEQAATEWDDEARAPTRLWERGQLAAALADTGAHLQSGELVTDRVALTLAARDFLRASIRRDRFRRRRAISVLSVLLALAVLAAGFAFAQRHATEQQREVAVSRQLVAQALELRATNPALAAQLALVAYRLAPTAAAHSDLLSIAADPAVTRLIGHTDVVLSVAFSPDGRTLASGSGDKLVRLWDISDPHHPRLLTILTGHTHVSGRTQGVEGVAFSPDGRTLATASADKTVRLWNTRDPHHPRPLGVITGHAGDVHAVAFSPDGRTVATGSADSTVRLWEVTTPQQPRLLSTLTGHTDVHAVAFSPDGRTLATGSDDATARLWDVSDPRHPGPLGSLTGHTQAVKSVAFSPDGHTLATGSNDKTVLLWDVGDPRQPHPLGSLTGHTRAVYSVAFSPDGHTLATGSLDNTVLLWNISDPYHPRLSRTLTGHTGAVNAVAFSRDGHTLATTSDDTTARLWDLSGPILTGHTGTIESVAISPGGRTLATASGDTTVRLWDIRDPRHPLSRGILIGHTQPVTWVVFNPAGRILATASDDGTARLWDVGDPRQPRPLVTLTGVGVAAFSPDGRTLATAKGEEMVQLWDLADPHRPAPLGTLSGGINAVVFSPDGHTLATASSEGTARLWDVGDPHQPHPLGTLTGHTKSVVTVAFSSDGHTLATGSADQTARLWDVRDPRHPRPAGILTGHTGTVWSVAFRPDQRILATGSDDRTVRLWDVRDPRQPRLWGILTGHTSGVESVAFSPDGHTLATGSADTTARLWDTNVDQVAARICRITPAITETEWDQYLPGLAYRPPCG